MNKYRSFKTVTFQVKATHRTHANILKLKLQCLFMVKKNVNKQVPCFEKTIIKLLIKYLYSIWFNNGYIDGKRTRQNQIRQIFDKINKTKECLRRPTQFVSSNLGKTAVGRWASDLILLDLSFFIYRLFLLILSIHESKFHHSGSHKNKSEVHTKQKVAVLLKKRPRF